MTEPERVQYIIRILSKDFVCVVEDIENNKRILGKHPTGKTLFIDALIRPKSPEGWRNGCNTVFGIEFKKDHNRERDMYKHIAQAIDYANSTWQYNGKEFGRIPILLCPSVHAQNDTLNKLDYFINRLLGEFNIGVINETIKYDLELRKRVNALTLEMSNTEFWTSVRGAMGSAISRKFDLKVGSR